MYVKSIAFQGLIWRWPGSSHQHIWLEFTAGESWKIIIITKLFLFSILCASVDRYTEKPFPFFFVGGCCALKSFLTEYLHCVMHMHHMEKKDSAERKKKKKSNRTIKDVGEIGVPIWCALGSASDAINDAGGLHEASTNNNNNNNNAVNKRGWRQWSVAKNKKKFRLLQLLF